MARKLFPFKGRLNIELTCADPAKALQTYVDNGFEIGEPLLSGPLVLQFTILRTQEKEIRQFAEKRGEICKVVGETGGVFFLRYLKKRVVFLAFFLSVLLFALLASNRVWFVGVEGNDRLEIREVLAAGEKCGLRFWVRLDSLNRQQFKNRLMQELPDLQWAGINYTGGIVTISIREKPLTEDHVDPGFIGDVVASRDGVILSVDALQGQSLCQVGQAVKEGEILITGCIEHPYQVLYTSANGEIYALTQREIRAVLPNCFSQKVYHPDEKLFLYLILGRNEIKILGNSRIYGMTCDKMRTVKDMLLPGGYRLPVSLAIERLRPYDLVERAGDAQQESMIAEYLDSYVQEDMIAGEIIDRKIQFTEGEEATEVYAIYTCREMIARQKKVIWFEGEDTNDRTDRKCGESGGSH